jgi:diadenosine tetraphosphate (Ap4A) HIT family hydrolase
MAPMAPTRSASTCLFCAILRGDQPGAFVLGGPRPGDGDATGDGSVIAAFLDVRPLAAAMEETLGAAGSFVALNNRVSQSVPHLHVHVVPRQRKDGLRGFFWPRTRYDGDDDLADWAGRLRTALS